MIVVHGIALDSNLETITRAYAERADALVRELRRGGAARPAAARPAASGTRSVISSIMGNLTKMEGEVCSAYSTSASAKAVRQVVHQ